MQELIKLRVFGRQFVLRVCEGLDQRLGLEKHAPDVFDGGSEVIHTLELRLAHMADDLEEAFVGKHADFDINLGLDDLFSFLSLIQVVAADVMQQICVGREKGKFLGVDREEVWLKPFSIRVTPSEAEHFETTAFLDSGRVPE